MMSKQWQNLHFWQSCPLRGVFCKGLEWLLSVFRLQDALATFDFLNNTVAKPDYDSLVENEQPDLELTAIQRKTEIR